MSLKSDVLLVGAIVVGGYVAWKKLAGKLPSIKDIGAALDPTADTNVAYTTAEKLTQIFTGDKTARVIDLFPPPGGSYSANAPDPEYPLIAPADAPYWYDANGKPRTTQMKRAGTVYGPAHNLIQVDANNRGRAI